jgi:predicted TPR repeat methyltransferase
LDFYEVLDAEPAEVRAARLDSRPQLEEGVSRYLAGETAAARQAFEGVLDRDPEDPVARLHLRQISDGL